MDAKKSPLALLAQTCSQIGADSPPSKSLPQSSQDKKKNSNNNNNNSVDLTNRTPPAKQEKPRTTPEIRHLAFKPYENNVLTRKTDEVRPSSKSSSDSSDERKSGKVTPGRKSSTPAVTTPAPDGGKSSPSTSERKTSSPAGSSGRGASPIIRSGLEVLQGHPKDMPLGTFKPGMGLGSLCCPPGLEQHNPAFRPPFAGAPFSHQHGALGSYPGANPYLGYARVKTPAGGDALVPVCKDPYCTGCQVSLHGQQLLMGGLPSCPAGCTQCDHHKYSLAMAMALSPSHSALSYAQLGRPYVCNWIAGESYCGKRFGTSEELLQHLRSHTAEGTPPGSSPLSPGFPVLGRYPGAPLSPLSAARFHPYAKPGLPLGSPYGFGPAALGPYYSPYALYGQRLGAAHQ